MSDRKALAASVRTIRQDDIESYPGTTKEVLDELADALEWADARIEELDAELAKVRGEMK